MTARALQRMIHVGCRELGIDADTRHDLQLRVVGKESLADMSVPELNRVIDALKGMGFQPSNGKRRPRAKRADVRFLHVMWRLLSEAGHTRQPGVAGLNAFIRARFSAAWGATPIDVDALREPQQINAVARALKDWCRRVGIDVK